MVEFFDASSDPEDGSVDGWSWDFGDGGSSTQPSPVYNYTIGGVYDVLLAVTDSDGATDTFGQQITVNSGTPALEMDVSALDGTSTRQGKKKWTAEVTIQIVDANRDPVTDAVVSGTWSDGSSGTCTTVDGTCSVKLAGLGLGVQIFTFSVDGVTHADLSYNANLYDAQSPIKIDQPVTSSETTTPEEQRNRIFLPTILTPGNSVGSSTATEAQATGTQEKQETIDADPENAVLPDVPTIEPDGPNMEYQILLPLIYR